MHLARFAAVLLICCFSVACNAPRPSPEPASKKQPMPTGQAAEPKTARIYSCDNYQPLGARPDSICFPLGDPKHMSIGIYPEPARGTASRVADTGDGLAVEILAERDVFGNRWYKIRIQDGGQTGWIGAHLTRLDD